MKKKVMLLMVLVSLWCATKSSAMDPIRENGPAAGEKSAAIDRVVAVVNSQAITASELDRHVVATKLPREGALEDLIDLQLLRAAAAARGVKIPEGLLSGKQRADIEYALAQALSLNPPAMRVTLVVDHAWLKDSADENEQTAGRARLERLRSLAEAGATIPQAYEKLQVDGNPWHIGDHEEYPAEVVPAEARDLPPGSLSGIIPGDGGLHLFRIYQVKKELPPSEEIHGLLLEWLRRDATIEYP